jgi:dipeptidyl aminopeptidase/acylaminoacyl peptidase
MAEQCPCGAWPSPVSAREAAGAVWLRSATLADDGAVWWQEIRPGEGGRGHLLRASADGHVTEVLDDRDGLEPGVLLPVSGGAMVMASDRDGRLFLLTPGARPRPLTPPPGPPPQDQVSALVAGPGGGEVWAAGTIRRGDATESSLVAVPLDGSAAVRTLLRTPQRISAPQPSPDGSMLAWISWDQQLMPWDEAELRVGRITRTGIDQERTLLGGPAEAVCHPQWASARSLYAVSDRSHWWNLYEIGLDGALRPLCPWAEEFGCPLPECARPTYGRLPDGRLAVLHGTGTWRLDLLDPADGLLLPLDLPYDCWEPAVHVMGTAVAGIAGGRSRSAAVVTVETADGQHRVLRQSAAAPPPAYLPEGIPETFAGRDGHEVHAVIYQPRNPGYRPLSGELVPYLIFLPDLPGAQPDRTPDLVRAFFTSRGLGVADVHGRGSAGYGRGYREQVYGRWGTADVEDCATVIRGLVSRWHADPERLALRGTGAGGATALGVLAGTDACAAATVYAPVTDLALPGSALTRYLRQIAADTTLLRSRSWADRIRRPVLMLHGLDDRIVPPDQSARLRDILHGRHVPHARLTFAAERHVFRGAAAIARALEAELSFYGQVLGFSPPATPHLALDSSSED